MIFNPNINVAGAIDLETPDGKRLRNHILGLSYYDAATGKSVLIAEVKDSIGQLVPPNQIIYADAFDDVLCDVRYTYTKAGLEQDLILREDLPAPETYGFDSATTRLEVFTEFLEPPVPASRACILKEEKDPIRRQVMVEPDLTDSIWILAPCRWELAALSSCRQQWMRGKRDSMAERLEEASMPIGKRWMRIENRDFLIEVVEFDAIKPQLKQLPGRPGADIGKAGNPVAKLLRKPTSTRQLPPIRQAANSDEVIRVAALNHPQEPGLVLDYTLVTGVSSFVFRGDTTYYVAGPVTLTDIIYFEGGAVIQYTNASNAKITLYGSIDSKAGPYRPVIVTAMDDNTVGEIIPASTGSPILTAAYGNPAFDIAPFDRPGCGSKPESARSGGKASSAAESYARRRFL